jgi:hypothetical protein
VVRHSAVYLYVGRGLGPAADAEYFVSAGASPRPTTSVYLLKNMQNIHCFLFIIHSIAGCFCINIGFFRDYNQNKANTTRVFWWVNL